MTDWESLSNQLKSLGVHLGKEARPTASRTKKFPIEEVIDGRFKEVIYGQVFCREERYPPGYLHGRKPLFLNDSVATLCRWANTAPYTQEDIQDFIFLDTETSGLAGGTGTYAFEVGVGRFTEDGFLLSQFFMRHPGEEPALLAGLTEFMDGMKAVVTYNGKSFDIPLLNTRYTMMGMSSPFSGIDHFDLLPLARRLWRVRLESRTLGNIEREILGVLRSNEEVSGYLIPEIYFEYLRSHDARPMAGIFYHNAFDILSLTGLFSHMAFLLDEPGIEKIESGEDVVALARFYESIQDYPQAKVLYHKALQSEISTELYWETLQRFSFLLKRLDDWQTATELWEQAAKKNALYAHEELAKFYEHRAKDIQIAIDWTEKALNLLNTNQQPIWNFHEWHAKFTHRLKRLTRKRGNQG